MYGFYNMTLCQAQLGVGQLKGFDGKTITVRFESGECRFWFPKAFEIGSLKVTNEKDAEIIWQTMQRWSNRNGESGECPRPQIAEGEVHLPAFDLQKVISACPKTAPADANSDAKKSISEQNERAAAKQENAPANAENQPADKSNGAAIPARKASKWRIGFGFGQASFVIAIVLSLISLVGGLILTVVGLSIWMPEIYVIGLAVFFVVGFLAHCLWNYVDGSDTTSKVFYYITALSYYGLILFVLFILYVVTVIIQLVRDDFTMGAIGSKGKEVYTINVNGYQRTLERDGVGYFGTPTTGHARYRDDLGHYWYSDDNARTFYQHN